MKFAGYFCLSMFIAIIVYLSFVNYMMRYQPNHFNAVPEQLMEKYNNETSKTANTHTKPIIK